MYKNKKIFLIIKYRGYNVKEKTKGQFDNYKTFELKDGTKFCYVDEKDLNFTGVRLRKVINCLKDSNPLIKKKLRRYQLKKDFLL